MLPYAFSFRLSFFGFARFVVAIIREIKSFLLSSCGDLRTADPEEG